MEKTSSTSIFNQLRTVADNQQQWPRLLEQISVALDATRLGLIGFPDPRIGSCFSAPIHTQDGTPLPPEHRSANGTYPSSGLQLPQDVWAKASTNLSGKADQSSFDPALIECNGSHWLLDVLHGYSRGNSVVICAEMAAQQSPSTLAGALAEFVPHVRQASQATLRLNLARAHGMLEMLWHLRCGGLLIDYTGRPIAHNDETLRLAECALVVSSRSLAATDPGADAALRKMLEEANRGRSPHTGSTSGAVILPRGSQPPLIACAVSIPGALNPFFHYARSVLKLVDTEHHQHPAILREAFGLTPAEVRLAIGLARGQSLQEFASANRIRVGTARVQLKSVFAKTNTRRQSELTALLARL